MADIVNLRRARKDQARSDKVAAAAENRVKFGRTKAEKTRDKAAADAERKRLDDLKLTDKS